MLRVVVKVPGEPAEVKEIEKGLKPLQEIVGGYVEAVYGGRPSGKPGRLAILCDDEGKLKGKQVNMEVWGHVLVGTVIICLEGRDAFEGFEEDEAKAIVEILN